MKFLLQLRTILRGVSGTETDSLALTVRQELTERTASIGLTIRAEAERGGVVVKRVYPLKQATLQEWVESLHEVIVRSLRCSPLDETRIWLALSDLLSEWHIGARTPRRLSVYLPNDLLYQVNTREG